METEMKTFEPKTLNMSSPEAIQRSVVEQIADWNAYYDEVVAEHLTPLFAEMRAAKVAYFNALNSVKSVTHAIEQQRSKLNDGLITKYAGGAHISRVDATYAAHRSKYISHNEIRMGKVIH